MQYLDQDSAVLNFFTTKEMNGFLEVTRLFKKQWICRKISNVKKKVNADLMCMPGVLEKFP